MDELLTKLGLTRETFIANDTFADAKGREIKIFWYNGTAYPPFGELPLSSMKGTEVRDGDVFLVGYPKTGAHWTYELLTMILHQEARAEGVGKTQCFLDMTDPGVIKAQPSPRVLNAHVRYDALPDQVKSKKTKMILTVRNPKDTLVSFFKFHHTFEPYGYDGEFNDFFEMFMEERVDYGCYFDYHSDWEKALKEHPDHPILVVSYEDMKEDLLREVRRMAEFLGVQLEDELMKDIARAGQYEAMVSGGRLSEHVARKGKVGDWKNWFTVAQNERMDAKIAKKGLTIYKPKYYLP